MPSEETSKKVLGALGGFLYAAKQVIEIYNGIKPSDKKINPDSDLEMAKKA